MYDDEKKNRNMVLLVAIAIAIFLVAIIIGDYRKNAKPGKPVDIKQAIVETPAVDVHANENENFVRLVYSETGDKSNSLNLAVANVVRNRIKSADFPNTINEVIFQSNQFPSVYNGSIIDYSNIPESKINNVQRCIDASANYDETNGAMFYYKISAKTDAENQWIMENFEHTVIDGYCFLKVFPYK